MSCRVLIVASGGMDSGHGGAVDLAVVVVVASGGTGTVVPSSCRRRRRLWWRGHGCHRRPVVVVVVGNSGISYSDFLILIPGSRVISICLFYAIHITKA